MKYQNLSIHRLKVSNFTEKSKNQSKLHYSVKILHKALKSLSSDLLLSPNQYTKYEGSSLNSFFDMSSNSVFNRA